MQEVFPSGNALPYVDLLREVNNIVEGTFKTSLIDSNYETYMTKMKTAFMKTNLSLTPKIHIFGNHLTQQLNYLGGRGLGSCSEQEGESIHSYFEKRF